MAYESVNPFDGKSVKKFNTLTVAISIKSICPSATKNGLIIASRTNE